LTCAIDQGSPPPDPCVSGPKFCGFGERDLLGRSSVPGSRDFFFVFFTTEVLLGRVLVVLFFFAIVNFWFYHHYDSGADRVQVLTGLKSETEIRVPRHRYREYPGRIHPGCLHRARRRPVRADPAVQGVDTVLAVQERSEHLRPGRAAFSAEQ
jgi:hypothetical protein